MAMDAVRHTLVGAGARSALEDLTRVGDGARMSVRWCGLTMQQWPVEVVGRVWRLWSCVGDEGVMDGVALVIVVAVVLTAAVTFTLCLVRTYKGVTGRSVLAWRLLWLGGIRVGNGYK